MDFNWLMDFVCLGRTLNFSRAAEERNVTQPAFSRRIKSLESWVGSTLVDRSTYPVQLTPAGKQFLAAAQETLVRLTDVRQSIRAAEQERLPFLRIAALHAISVNFLQERIAAFETNVPDLRTRVVSDSMAACCQLLADGGCDFLFYYRHQSFEPLLDENRFLRKDICTESLIPVAHYATAAKNGWTLGGRSRIAVPYLCYDPHTFLGTVVDQTIGNRQTALNGRYMDALAETLKRRALAGAGVAWLPEFSIAKELEEGQLVRMGGPTWVAQLTISLFCSPGRLGEVGHTFWESF